MLKKLSSFLLCGILLLGALTACAKPQEEARQLAANGFTAQYHSYMWGMPDTSAEEGMAETVFTHNEEEAFFSVLRIDAARSGQMGVAGEEELEILLKSYVQNSGGTKEKIAKGDTEHEYVQNLSFEFYNEKMNDKYTYLAKAVLNKTTGELMVALAAYPNNGSRLLKEEVNLLMSSVAMANMEETGY